MNKLFAPYQSVFAIAGARPLFLVAFLARVPFTAKSTALTFHVALDQHRTYGEAGLVGMALTIGMAVGAPLLGRMIDRRGLRPVLVLCGSVELAYWTTAYFLPYPVLMGTTLVVGALGLPVFAVMRQAVAAKVPAEQRRQAFALDSMIVELAFTIGPAAAILTATSMGTAGPMMAAIGVLALGSVAALFRLDPPIGKGRVAAGETAEQHQQSEDQSEKMSLRAWTRPGFLLILATCLAASLVLTGTDIAMFATLRGLDQTRWLSVAIIVWCLASMAGGFWHGSTSRPATLPVLMLVMAAATIPVGLIGDHGWYWLCLALIPAGFVCAPTLASAAEAISKTVPPAARGQAMGLQGSAQTIGGSVGAPLVGFVIDHGTAAWGFATAGMIGGTLAVVTFVYSRVRPWAATETVGSAQAQALGSVTSAQATEPAGFTAEGGAQTELAIQP